MNYWWILDIFDFRIDMKKDNEDDQNDPDHFDV